MIPLFDLKRMKKSLENSSRNQQTRRIVRPVPFSQPQGKKPNNATQMYRYTFYPNYFKINFGSHEAESRNIFEQHLADPELKEQYGLDESDGDMYRVDTDVSNDIVRIWDDITDAFKAEINVNNRDSPGAGVRLISDDIDGGLQSSDTVDTWEEGGERGVDTSTGEFIIETSLPLDKFAQYLVRDETEFLRNRIDSVDFGLDGFYQLQRWYSPGIRMQSTKVPVQFLLARADMVKK